MFTFIVQNWSSILLALITAGSIGFCKYMQEQVKVYKKMLDEKEDEQINKQIDIKLAPVVEAIKELQDYIERIDNQEQAELKLIIDSYKLRLVEKCHRYLKQQYITTEQYEQLSDFYRLYQQLGGNGQAKEYYEKVIKLPIKENQEED